MLAPSHLAVLLLLTTFGCDRGSAPTQEARPEENRRRVSLITVATEPVPRFLTLSGTVVPDQQSDLAATAAGRVLAVNVERGQQVDAGEVVVQLDGRQARYSATSAKAQFALAKEQRELAKLECERADQLLTTGTISRAEYDRTKSQCETARRSVDAAESNAALAAVQAGDTLIRAPFAGVVAERFVDVGEYVQPSSRVLSLVATDPVRLRVAVPQAHVPQVAPEQAVTFTIDALPDRTFTGEIKYMSPTVREATRDLVVEAVVPNPDGALHAGMFARVSLPIGTEARPAVPSSAVVRDGPRRLVWVVREHRAVQQLIREGGTTPAGRVAILAGVSEGDRIVADPPDDLRDGTLVE